MSEKRKEKVLVIEEVKLIQPYAALPPTLLQLQAGQVQQHNSQHHINNTSNWHLHFSRACVCIKGVYFAMNGTLASEARYQ